MLWITPVPWPIPAPVGNADFDRIEGNLDYIYNTGIKPNTDATWIMGRGSWYGISNNQYNSHYNFSGSTIEYGTRFDPLGGVVLNAKSDQALDLRLGSSNVISISDALITISKSVNKLDIDQNNRLGWIYNTGSATVLHSIVGGGDNPLVYKADYTSIALANIHEFWGNKANEVVSITNDGTLNLDNASKIRWNQSNGSGTFLHSIVAGGSSPIKYTAAFTGSSTTNVHEFYGNSGAVFTITNNGSIAVSGNINPTTTPTLSALSASVNLETNLVPRGMYTGLIRIQGASGTSTVQIQKFLLSVWTTIEGGTHSFGIGTSNYVVVEGLRSSGTDTRMLFTTTGTGTGILNLSKY